VPAPTVLIVANPYEAERIRRAVEEGSLRAVVADGGEGWQEAYQKESPSVVVLATKLHDADTEEILTALKAHDEMRVPVILIEDPGGPLSAPAVARVHGADILLLRPIDPILLLARIEQLGEPEIEIDGGDADLQIEEPPAPRMARIMTAVPLPEEVTRATEPMAATPAPAAPAAEKVAAPVRAPTAEMVAARASTAEMPSVRAAEIAAVRPTEPMSVAQANEQIEATRATEQMDAVRATEQREAVRPTVEMAAVSSEPAPTPTPSRTRPGYPMHRTEVMPAVQPLGGGLLRADDAIDLTATMPDVDAPPRPAGGGKKGRRPDDQPSAAEQRLFPGGARPPRPGNEEPTEVDLDKIGLDTLPGIDLELGLDGAGLKEAARKKPGKTQPQPFTVVKVPPDARTPVPAGDATAARSDEAPARGDESQLVDSGALGEVGLPDLLARLYRAGFTGRLILRRGDGERSIYFEAGYPVWAASNLPHDHLADLLWREGRLSRADHARVAEISPEQARRVGDVLVQRGVLPREELFPALRRHIQEVLYSCFAWESGTWTLGAHDAAPVDRVRIDAHPYAIAVEGIRRKYGLERLSERVGPPTTIIAPTPALDRVANLAALGEIEKTAVKKLADGPLSVGDLALRAGMSETAAYVIVHALTALGGLARSEQSAGDSPVRSRPVDRERALAKHAQVADGDYFDVLGVAHDATAYEIRRAWERLRQEFSAERLEPELRDELGERLSEIAEVVDEAYRVLADDAIRAAYRAALAE
jgi:hypothetical protein